MDKEVVDDESMSGRLLDLDRRRVLVDRKEIWPKGGNNSK